MHTLFRLICPFKCLSLLVRITSNFQLWLLTMELPVNEVLRYQYVLLPYLNYLLSDWEELVLVKAE